MKNADNIKLLYSNPYEEVRDLCHAVKTPGGFLDVPKKIYFQAGSALGRRTVLVPVPGHDGTPNHTLDMCISIRNNNPWKDIRIVDALRGHKRPSLCEIKQQGGDPNDIKVAFHVNLNEIEPDQVKTLAKSFDIVLVDNVVDSGRTALAAQKAIGVPCGLITIGSTGASGLPMPKLYYEVVRVSNQDIDQEAYEAMKTIVDRDGNYEEAVRYLSNLDYGAENLSVALSDNEGMRATATDPKSLADKVIDTRDSYFLCRSKGTLYDAFYLVKEVPREDPLPEGANARTGKGTPVHFDFIPDCGPNTGGNYVEIFINEPEYGFEGDRYDDLCVHPEDCDCSDKSAVEKYIKEQIAQILNY